MQDYVGVFLDVEMSNRLTVIKCFQYRLYYILFVYKYWNKGYLLLQQH